jgi:glyoxylase I family protein
MSNTVPNMAGAPCLTSIHHLGITVTDIERSEAWYGRVLGLRRVFVENHHQSTAGGYAVVMANETGSVDIGLDHHPGNDGTQFDARRNGLDHVCFAVGNKTDLQPWIQHLDSQDVQHSGIYDIDGMPMAVVNFRDPDGIPIELISIN